MKYNPLILIMVTLTLGVYKIQSTNSCDFNMNKCILIEKNGNCSTCTVAGSQNKITCCNGVPIQPLTPVTNPVKPAHCECTFKPFSPFGGSNKKVYADIDADKTHCNNTKCHDAGKRALGSDYNSYTLKSVSQEGGFKCGSTPGGFCT